MKSNVEKFMSYAVKIRTPLALSGIIVVVLYAIYRQVLSLNVFENVGSNPTFLLLQNVLDKVFWLALIAILLGVASYLVTVVLNYKVQFHSSQIMPISTSLLEIISVEITHNFELDITLRNIGEDAAVIHCITITILEDHSVVSQPWIRPSAKYGLPINDLAVGESKSITVHHLVEAHKADRFKIALHTTRALLIRLTVEYNKGQRVEIDQRI